MNKDNNKQICEKIYNTSVLLDNYCKNNKQAEEIQNISPIIEYLRKQSDKLYTQLLDLK